MKKNSGRSFSEQLHDKLLDIYRKYQAKKAAPVNLEGDRDIEWSFIAAHLPPGHGRALDFGSGTSIMGLAAARKGYDVLCTDLRPIQWYYRFDRIRFQQGDALKMGLGENSLSLIINCSTVEHVGLAGRYGVEVYEPEGDLEAMKILRCLLEPGGIMLLTIPVGLDAFFLPICRVYGRERLPHLLTGYEIEKEEYWVKDEKNQWIEASKEEALSFNSSMRSWNARQNVCALGCFVLRKGRDGSNE